LFFYCPGARGRRPNTKKLPRVLTTTSAEFAKEMGPLAARLLPLRKAGLNPLRPHHPQAAPLEIFAECAMGMELRAWTVKVCLSAQALWMSAACAEDLDPACAVAGMITLA